MTLCAVIGLGLRQLWLALPVGLLAHSIAVWLTRQDARTPGRQDAWWLDVLKRHLREKVIYEA